MHHKYHIMLWLLSMTRCFLNLQLGTGLNFGAACNYVYAKQFELGSMGTPRIKKSNLPIVYDRSLSSQQTPGELGVFGLM